MRRFINMTFLRSHVLKFNYWIKLNKKWLDSKFRRNDRGIHLSEKNFIRQTFRNYGLNRFMSSYTTGAYFSKLHFYSLQLQFYKCWSFGFHKTLKYNCSYNYNFTIVRHFTALQFHKTTYTIHKSINL